jgi:hypothetical protein
MALSKQLQRIHEAIMTIKQYGGVFGRNPTFNDVTIEGQLTFDGDIDINSDLKVSGDIETTGNVIIATSGKGIDFSATAGTGTSELLDDYEEGLYTATLTPSTSGTITVNSSNDQLAYTKIGRVVYVQGFISSSGVSSPVGGVVYLNLPFAPATLSEGAGFSTGAFIFADAPSYALTNYGCIVSPGGSSNQLLISASLVGNGDEFQIGFNYITL